MTFNGFPLQQDINTFRITLWETYRNTTLCGTPPNSNKSSTEKVASWMGHKAVTCLSIVINPVLIGVCITGMVATICVLGALKISIFASRLGHYKSKLSTGYFWLGGRTLHSIYHTYKNVEELIVDMYDPLYQGQRAFRYLGKQLGLGKIIETTITSTGNVFIFIDKRIDKGFEKANEVELDTDWKSKQANHFRCLSDMERKTDCAFLRALNDQAARYRIKWDSDRSWSAIGMHTIYSAISIPLNAVACAVNTIGTIILGTLFIGKALIYAGTNWNIIDRPTNVNDYLNGTFYTLANTFIDTAGVLADAVIVLYKTADAVGVVKAVAKVGKILLV